MTTPDRRSGAKAGALTNAGWNAFATIFSIAVSFLLAPLLIHHLGAANYGLLLLVWSVSGLLAVTNLGVGEATLRFVSHHYADGDMAAVNRVFGSTLAFYLVLSIVLLLLAFGLTGPVLRLVNVSPEERGSAAWLFRLAVVLFSAGMIANAFRSIPMALHRYDVASRMSLAQGVGRTVGFAALAMTGFGVLPIIMWDVMVAGAFMVVQVVVAVRLLPALRVAPTLSVEGFREIFGYGLYVFLTGMFLSFYRESGKLVLGKYAGPVGVAYLGTPDNIANRLYTIVISGVETLMPRFSAMRDTEAACTLLVKATYGALACVVTLLVPLAVLMSDFLLLWISPEFARESAAAGQLLTLALIAPAAFAPIATYYRGTGRPGFVAIVMVVTGTIVVAGCLRWVPTSGAVGAAYAYVAGSLGWLGGLVWGWFSVFGVSRAKALVRSVAAPLALAAVAFAVASELRGSVGELGWPGLLVLGASFAGMTSGLLMFVDWAIWNESPLAEAILERTWRAPRFRAIRKSLSAGAV